jgi:riboflavin-specific deaminase-like protein
MPRAHVLANFASTLDGKIAPAAARRSGPVALSAGAEDHARMRALRSRADAVLIGAGNLRSDDPDLALPSDERERRRAHGRPEPLRVVLTRSGQGIAPGQRVFDPALGGHTIVVHPAAMPSERRAALSGVAELVCLGDDAVPMPTLLAWLLEVRGIETVLCEGGGVIAEQLFRARAVDELYLTLVPRVLGGGGAGGAPTLAEGPGFRIGELPDARLTSLERVGDELFLRYQFTWS